jgi:hypothetical protein
MFRPTAMRGATHNARRDAQEEELLADILCAERLGGLRKHLSRAA